MVVAAHGQLLAQLQLDSSYSRLINLLVSTRICWPVRIIKSFTAYLEDSETSHDLFNGIMTYVPCS